jgi:hypothetical protein
MHSSFDSVNSKLELETDQISFFSDTISGLRTTIEGLSQLAGLEGLDGVAAKLQEAVEECEVALSISITSENVHPACSE